MAMPTFTMRDLLETGVHFGHHTRRWDPRMKSYIFGVRNNIHILDLQQTVPLLHRALQAVRDTVARGGRVLFVGTKRQAAETIAETASQSGQYFVNHRWLGGMLTNWKTISGSIKRLRELEEQLAQDGIGLTKKELLGLTRQRDKLEQALGGIKEMGGLPDIMVIIDTNKEAIAIAEANTLGIPVVAILDSNSNPNGVDYPIPGNDDAMRAITLYCDLISGAILDGLQQEATASGKDLGEAVEAPVEPALEETAAAASVEAVSAEAAPGSGRRATRGVTGTGPGSCHNRSRAGGRRANRPNRGLSRAGTIGHGRRRTPALAQMWIDELEGKTMAVTASMVKELREKSGAGMMDCKKALNETDGDVDAAVDWLRKKGLAAAAKKSGRVAAEGLIGAVTEGVRGALVEVNSETDFVARNEDFQGFVSSLARLTLDSDGQVDALMAMDFPGTGRKVDEELTHNIATIGENMTVRRAATQSVGAGTVVSYVHNATAAGLGKIGVLVALESTGDADQLTALGKQIAMHIAATAPASVSVDDLDPALVERERAVLSDQARASGKPEEIIAKMVEGRLRKYYEEAVLLEQVFVIDNETKVGKVVENAAADIGAPVKIAGFSRLVLGEGVEREETDFAAEVAAQLGG